eukprot:3992455-Alexandrium_andersonii.AAC.1
MARLRIERPTTTSKPRRGRVNHVNGRVPSQGLDPRASRRVRLGCSWRRSGGSRPGSCTHCVNFGAKLRKVALQGSFKRDVGERCQVRVLEVAQNRA